MSSSVSPIDPHPRRRNVHPYPLGWLRAHALEPLRERRNRVVGELDEGRARRHQVEGVKQEAQTHPQRLGEQRETGHHARSRILHQPGEQPLEAVGIALHHRGPGIARTQQPAEGRIELDENEPRRIGALRHQRLGDRAGAWTKLDDRTRPARIDIRRHGARERAARRRHRAERQRFLDPGADETDFVVEPDAVLLLEATDLDAELALLHLEALLELAPVALELLLDLFLERTLLLLEDLDVPLDLPLQLNLLDLKQALLLLEFLFEELQGGKRHEGANAAQ